MDGRLYKNYPLAVRETTKWISIGIRAVEVWLLISGAEVIHGAARITFLQPLVGDFPARQIAVFTGSAVILAVAFLFRDWTGAKTFSECFAVGALWVLLTIGFEIFLGRTLMDLTWERILSDYDIGHGGLMSIGLTLMFLAPLIASRLRTSHARSSSTHASDTIS